MSGHPRRQFPQEYYRVVRMLKKYDRSKLSAVESAFKSYSGKEAALVTYLVKKHGDEPPMENILDRVVRIYEKYAPTKVDDAEKAVKKFKGRDEELIRQLVDKYGEEPEPPTPRAHDGKRTRRTSSGASPSGSPSASPKALHERASLSHEERLKIFYAKYAPDKTDKDVKKTLKTFRDHPKGYKEMWRALEEKYGPEPHEISADEEAQRARLKRFYAKYRPERTDKDIDIAMKKFGGKPGGFDEMWRELVDKYGPEPTEDPEGSLEYQLNKMKLFYNKYDPSRTEKEMLTALNQYGQLDNGYEKMWKALENKYGPAPPMPQESLMGPSSGGVGAGFSATDTAIVTLEEIAQHRERLARFYAYYMPSKTSADIETALSVYKEAEGGYAKMWQDLEKKYGKEPSMAHSGKQPTIPAVQPPSMSSRSAGLIDAPESAIKRSHPSLRMVSASPTREEAALKNAPTSAFGHSSDVLRCIVRFFGADFGYYEHSDAEQRHSFREAIERDVAVNLQLHPRAPKVTRLSAGSIVAEIDVELHNIQEPFGIGDMLVRKIQSGTFTVANVRESYRNDLGGNPLQVYADGGAVVGGSCTTNFRTSGYQGKPKASDQHPRIPSIRPLPDIPPLMTPPMASPRGASGSPHRGASPYDDPRQRQHHQQHLNSLPIPPIPTDPYGDEYDRGYGADGGYQPDYHRLHNISDSLNKSWAQGVPAIHMQSQVDALELPLQRSYNSQPRHMHASPNRHDYPQRQPSPEPRHSGGRGSGGFLTTLWDDVERHDDIVSRHGPPINPLRDYFNGPPSATSGRELSEQAHQIATHSPSAALARRSGFGSALVGSPIQQGDRGQDPPYVPVRERRDPLEPRQQSDYHQQLSPYRDMLPPGAEYQRGSGTSFPTGMESYDVYASSPYGATRTSGASPRQHPYHHPSHEVAGTQAARSSRNGGGGGGEPNYMMGIVSALDYS